MAGAYATAGRGFRVPISYPVAPALRLVSASREFFSNGNYKHALTYGGRGRSRPPFVSGTRAGYREELLEFTRYMDWKQAGCVFFGAGCGAVLRWRLTLWGERLLPSLPPGTMVINLLGSLLIGVVAGFFERRAGLPVELRLLLATGFLGGFTTFSAFSLEAADWIGSRSPALILLLILKVALCIGLAYAGLMLGRRI